MRLAGILLTVLIAPCWLLGQVNQSEEPKHQWTISGLFSFDFYPFKNLNSRKFYETQWQFNHSYGIELLKHYKKNKRFGGSIIYSVKDHDEELNCVDCDSLPQTPTKLQHSVRYIEIPITFRKTFFENQGNSLFYLGAIQPAFIHKAESKASFKNGESGSLEVNDQQFGRFLLGVKGGIGFKRMIDQQVGVEVMPYFKLYGTDLFRDGYLNFTSFGVTLKLTHDFQ